MHFQATEELLFLPFLHAALPLLVQVVVAILFLPVVAGLWVWETTWPLLVRLILVIGVAGWNLLIFLPKAAQSARP